MHTKLKGDIGELAVAGELLRLGWNVSFPYGENLKYDLIVEKQGKMKRVQVKTVIPKNGALRINCRSSNNWTVVHYNKNDFEVLAVYDLIAQDIYFIPVSKINKSLINLRLKPAKNFQKLNINLAKSFKSFN